MNIENFLQKISEQFEMTDTSLIKPETEFKQLEEWSSMHALLIIALIDAEYNVPFSGEDLQNCNTISDIYNTVQSRMSING